MRIEHRTEQDTGTTGPGTYVDLRDLAFAAIADSPFARVLPRPAGFYPAARLHALLAQWETALEDQAVRFTEYPRRYEAAFDAAGAAPIAFVDLPLGLQEIVGGCATDVWYQTVAEHAKGDVQGALRKLPPEVLGLVRSTWTRRAARVRELRAYLLTPWAVHHLWNAHSGFLADQRLGRDFRAVLLGHAPSAPMIVYEGAVHRDLVTYGLAMLRALPPDMEICWLEGTAGAASAQPIPVPRAPKSAWTTDGVELRAADDWGTTPAERQVLRERAYRESVAPRQGRVRAITARYWDAMGLGAALDAETGLPRIAGLPYQPAPSLAAQARWVPIGMGAWDRPVPPRGSVLARAWRAVERFLPDSLAVVVTPFARQGARDRARTVRTRLEAARITQCFPEVRTLVASLSDRMVERAARAA